MKHAYLIEAHNNPNQLIKLLNLLDCMYNDLYIHIDVKSEELYQIVKNLKLQKSKLYFTDRISVAWGGYSQIEAEIILLETALKNGEYSRFHLISGGDLPLKSQKNVYDYFESNSDVEFVHFDYKNDIVVNKNRMAHYHFFQEKINRNNKTFHNLEKICLVIQKIIRINRIKDINMEIRKGSNWLSITNECAKYIISKKSWIEKYFKNTKCCDEVFFQTLVWNSKFRDKLYYDIDEKRCGNMRLIDWKRGNPYTFHQEDYDELINSKYMFARKFDEKIDNKIIDKICDYIKED